MARDPRDDKIDAQLRDALDPDRVFAAKLITRGPICRDCIVRETGTPIVRVDEFLSQLQRTLWITVRMAPCPSCQTARAVYRLR